MGESVYDNPHAERLNRTIKNNYLIPYNPESPSALNKLLKKAVEMYNYYKPHKALNGQSPDSFEIEMRY